MATIAHYTIAPLVKDQLYAMGVPADVSTSYVERQNLTMRMHMRRFT